MILSQYQHIGRDRSLMILHRRLDASGSEELPWQHSPVFLTTNMSSKLKKAKSLPLFSAEKSGLHPLCPPERRKLERMIEDALLEVLLYRPADPYKFLAIHFEWEITGSNPLKKACQLLSTVRYNSLSFYDVLSNAYIIVGHHKVSVSSNVKGITGDVYMDLLRMLCSGMGETEEACLLDNLFILPREVVSFQTFSAGVSCCILFKDYLEKARTLCSELWKTMSGADGKALVCRVLLELGYAEADSSDEKDSDFKRSLSKRNDNTEAAAEFLNALIILFWRTVIFS